MGKKVIPIGQRFERLVFTGRYDKKVNPKSPNFIFCICDCGQETKIRVSQFISGTVKSCGCIVREQVIQRNTKHGLYDHRLRRTYKGIKERCYNPNSDDYKNYGGRGIKMCDEWLKDFMAFFNWSIENGYDDKLTIDRRKNDLGYSPENCRWITRKEQCNNKRTNIILSLDGESKTIAQWADDGRCVVSDRILRQRIQRDKWSFTKALTTQP